MSDIDSEPGFPKGSGDPNCPKCKGRGVVSITLHGFPGGGTQNCDCVFKRDLLANVERVWKVLLTIESAPSSPLLKLTNQSLWITASNYDFRRHLRYVAFRMGPSWDARVIADATLITAWLSTAKDVLDPDVSLERQRERPSDDFLTLVDLAVPFDLLIIRLGVKAAKNREMPNVLAEAINEREQVGKPTWIVDSPLKPLAPGHICYGEQVVELLDGFRRVVISDTPQTSQSPVQHLSMAPTAGGRPTSAGSVGTYTRMKPGMVVPTPAPPPAAVPPVRRQEPAPVVPEEAALEQAGALLDDEDEFSVDSLMTSAVDPALVKGSGLLQNEGFDPDEELSNYPTPEELGANGVPAFLAGVTLTKEDRLAEQAKAKRAKQWQRNKKRGDS